MIIPTTKQFLLSRLSSTKSLFIIHLVFVTIHCIHIHSSIHSSIHFSIKSTIPSETTTTTTLLLLLLQFYYYYTSTTTTTVLQLLLVLLTRATTVGLGGVCGRRIMIVWWCHFVASMITVERRRKSRMKTKGGEGRES